MTQAEAVLPARAADRELAARGASLHRGEFDYEVRTMENNQLRETCTSRRGRSDSGGSLLLALAVALFLALAPWRAAGEEQPGEQGQKNGASPARIAVALNDPIELDFQKKATVYKWRKFYAGRYPQILKALVKGSYEPSEAVFGQVEDDRPWWGLVGQMFYGPGEKSIEGRSEESRFFANPYMLVGMTSVFPTFFNIPDKSRTIELYLKPVDLYWSADFSYAWVTYDWSAYVVAVRKAVRRYDGEGSSINLDDYARSLGLVAYNARDFGFEFLAVDTKRTRSFRPDNGGDKVIRIPQFIHKGGSCGYPGGGNNMSPRCPDLDDNRLESVKKLPAYVYLKLWSAQPDSAAKAPDMWYIIEIR